MANDYFKFKEFTVHQSRASMKVCTDSCLFGAWAAQKLANLDTSHGNMLDIGTGTGLLSLMIAQKTDCRIDAIEIDPNAYIDALENFKGSPWIHRLQLFHGDIKNWKAGSRYDCIISNPPFYENDLRSPDQGINASRHDLYLGIRDLLLVVGERLQDTGTFMVLLPWKRVSEFENEATQNGLFVTQILKVRQSPNHPFFRAILLLQKRKQTLDLSQINIRGEDNRYSNEFIQLLTDYYLQL